MQPKGTIDARVLSDGTVRAETGDMGGVAHKAADEFFAYLARLCGGAVVDRKVDVGHQHAHGHGHAHGEGGHHHAQ